MANVVTGIQHVDVKAVQGDAGEFVLEVCDLSELKKVVRAVGRVKGVISVERRESFAPPPQPVLRPAQRGRAFGLYRCILRWNARTRSSTASAASLAVSLRGATAIAVPPYTHLELVAARAYEAARGLWEITNAIIARPLFLCERGCVHLRLHVSLDPGVGLGNAFAEREARLPPYRVDSTIAEIA